MLGLNFFCVIEIGSLPIAKANKVLELTPSSGRLAIQT